jgi:hypothetical protein
MQVRPITWTESAGWAALPPGPPASLVLYVGSRAALADGARHAELLAAHPGAIVVGATSGGHGLDAEVGEAGLAGVAASFAATRLSLAMEEVADPADTRSVARRLGERLHAPDLAGVLLLSDGLHVNGTALAAGLTEALGPSVPVSGGLAGDGASFGATLIAAGAAPPAERRIVAIGFHGEAIRLGHGCAGGWSPFGPLRRITRSADNVLHELDGAPALDLYERYLGEEAAGLPGTALLYPLRIWDPREPAHDVVRTVLQVDRAARSMTFAGDMPQGWRAQLMRASIDHLCEGAAQAARDATRSCPDGDGGPALGILVSCIGRRLLMGQRAGEEIEAAAAQFPPGTQVLAFYSYGELAPRGGPGHCELHNQTMTVTLLREAA